MSVAYKIITPVSTEPITLADAKAQLRVDFDDEDSLISHKITSARAYAEAVTHRALATQVVQTIYTIDRPTGGEMYGPLQRGPNWYEYQEELGSNPFGAAMFFFDMPLPPFQLQGGLSVQTRTTVWDDWEDFTGLYTIDDTIEPCRIYFQVPVTANQWKFQYTCGYNDDYPLPGDLYEATMELLVQFYQNREGQAIPQEIINKLLARKVDW